MKPRVIITAKKVNYCTIFSPGDKMIWRGHELLVNESTKACGHAITAFQPIVTAIEKGAKLSDFGSKEKLSLRCVDAETGGVIFELKVEYPEE